MCIRDSYDSDIKSGGFGARVLGIQANKQYRQDIVTIIIRLVNVQTGEVVLSTTVEKTIFSTSTGADIFKYFDTDTMLVEVEAGYARNEPVTFAVRKAIEKGVVDVINAGVQKGLWEFEPVKEVIVPEIIDYVDTETDISVDIGEEKVEKTYEDYLAEKEKQKEERKKQIQEELKQEENADETDNDSDSDSSGDTK